MHRYFQQEAKRKNVTLDFSGLNVSDYTKAGDKKAQATELLRTLSGMAVFFSEEFKLLESLLEIAEEAEGNVCKEAINLQDACTKAKELLDPQQDAEIDSDSSYSVF